MATAQDERSNPFVWFAAVAVVLVLGTLGVIAFAVLRSSDAGPTATPTPTRSASRAGPSLLGRDVTIRAAPDNSAREVARASANTPVRLAGRLADSSWYAIEVVGRVDALGWVPADALDLIEDPGAVPVLVAPASAGGPTSTRTPVATDLANLVFEGVYVRRNRLVAVIANDGYIDVRTPIMVRVGADGQPYRVDVVDKPLRPGDEVEVPLEGEYVQRRASISASVSTTVREEDEADNRIEATVEPDEPIDLEVLSATLAPELAVTLRNNSSIPIVGTVTLTVRETRPSDRLLSRLDDAPIGIPAGGVQVLRFPGLASIDLTRVQLLLETTAINDANRANDVYPR